ncbi:multiheme c-type cytochrome [Gilvimarinus sp. SDUM040013]|uniref:Multiheme c-type cytochrome n=1 Tax=Gilvimarinus gilvus TaxID=3058038 RepID=A0ABU4RYE3_9GAMM|nr:tetratricopeptide repeat protein [Gilvimarinus sp. SDUM040013]MDO3388480.1 multiheme c-type cytochrome [Gilvimarinus sp. SDUM040013]MDX6848648.1 multiheme c-type cytochrome [Gilvimarinus sp. SDUM040013]
MSCKMNAQGKVEGLLSVWMVFVIALLGAEASAAAKELQNCASCHAEQVADWQSSHHFHAMAQANSATNVGDFSNQSVAFEGGSATFNTVDGQYSITMPGLDGKQAEYKVAHTFGYHPLQQYMFEQEPGKFQLFPFAWDARTKAEGGQRWFVLHPEQGPNDEFHWSQMGQNWNQMCADCHSTEFRKGFDVEKNKYQSTYSEINVSCAACHGDGSEHLRWAAGDKTIEQKGYPNYIGSQTPLFRADDEGLMKNIAALKPSKQVDVCASCHARRAPFSDQSQPDDFHHTYQPSLITPDLYHVDGQIWDEDYVWGSFLQSKMHQAGVTCTNCHNPHSGGLKLPGNQLCTQCHEVSQYDAKTHHGHQANTQGAYCVDCHMPATTYMQVDDRRDHAFKVPRPDLTQSVGAPNACNGCHEDKAPAWAEQAIREWHPDSLYMGSEHFAQAFHKAAAGAADAGQELTKIAQNPQYPDIIRASALQRMAQTPGRNAIVAIARAVRDDDPLKRQAAITAAAPYPMPDQWRMLNSLLDDPRLPVRVEAARALAQMLVQPPETSLLPEDKKRLESALAEYREVQAYAADRGFSHTNLGNLEQIFGRSRNAEKLYRKAIEVEPIFIPAYVNLADLYRERRDEDEARAILTQALAIQPEAATVQYAMAMSYVRSGDKAKATGFLKQAASGVDPNPRFVYTYALLLQDLGDGKNARQQLQRAYTLDPMNPDVSYSLTISYQASGDYRQALHYANKLAELVPNNAQVEQLIQQIKQQSAAQ